MRSTTAMVLAGGINLGFSVLTHNRVKSAMPVCGNLRIIDFVLTNLSRSGIDHVGVLIQYLPGSLIEHVGVGEAWDFNTTTRRIKLMPPFVGMGKTRWFRGSADAIYQNMDYVVKNGSDHVLILTADHLYSMDYGPMIAFHKKKDADLTILTTPAPRNVKTDLFGYVGYGEGGRVEKFVEKPDRPATDTVSTGVYLFKAGFLFQMLDRLRDENEISHPLPTSVVVPVVNEGRAFGYRFEGEWEYLPDLEAYVGYHLRLLGGEAAVDPNAGEVQTNLLDRALGSRPSPFFGPRSAVEESMVSCGCRIEGEVARSVLSPGVRVAPGAVVRDSILFHDCLVEEGARLEGVVGDKDIVFNPFCRVGEPLAGQGFDPGRPSLRALTVVGKGAQVLQGARVGAGEEIPVGQVVDREWAATHSAGDAGPERAGGNGAISSVG